MRETEDGTAPNGKAARKRLASDGYGWIPPIRQRDPTTTLSIFCATPKRRKKPPPVSLALHRWISPSSFSSALLFCLAFEAPEKGGGDPDGDGALDSAGFRTNKIHRGSKTNS